MDMNERKFRILEAIIQDYIQTGDPVGSRTLSKKYELGISSATIRNEMSDLEELGFIMQPHTSAGRVPSDKGYRLYVDQLMTRPDIAPEVEGVIARMITDKMGKIDNLLDETAKLISMMTNYATVASTPSIEQTKIKHLQLVPVDERSVACVIVTDTNIVKNHVINTYQELDYNLCIVITNILNECLKGSTLSEISLDKIHDLEFRMKEYREMAEDIIAAIIKTLKAQDVPDIYTRGAMNILNFQEFNDIEKAKQVLELLEQKPYLIKLLGEQQGQPVTISIGEENVLEPMKNCSVITTSYSIGGYNLGTIGIIGPTRMNYGQVVSILEHISYHMNNLLMEPKDP